MWFLVMQDAGGALNSLTVHASNAGAALVTKQYPLRNFSRPRFVRGKLPYVSAIMDNKQLVVFPARTPADCGSFVELGVADDGELLAIQENYILFLKSKRAGKARGGVLPGELKCTSLDRQFKEVKALVAPFGTEAVYEFSACAIDKSPAVLGTLADGLSLALLRDRRVQTMRFTAPGEMGEAFSPTICTAASDVHVAILVSPKTRDARILYGKVPISQVTEGSK